ncbi:MAG: GAF domain-containing sensor histidine kinase [Potamolinea sp.]
MADPENRIFCRLDDLTPALREQKRLKTIRELGILEAETVPVFDEATQTAARFLEAPIAILGLMMQERQLLKSAFGLSSVGLMNQLAQSRQLPRLESFCTYVVDSHQVLAINDTASNPVFARSLLVGHYGIRAYLGAPLLTADGECVGTLAVMDWQPRCFTTKDRDFLAITARWSLSEFERSHLLQKERIRYSTFLPPSSAAKQLPQIRKFDSTATPVDPNSANLIKVKLLTQLAQELRTPLTSVMGMASVLNRQIYGPLTTKQKEYLEIIHRSGQQLVSLVDEIIDLGFLEEIGELQPAMSVDIEMICQQAMNSLLEMAKVRQQEMRLSIEPGSRIWLLNKDKVRQMLYYLIFSVIHAAEAGGEVRVHVSRKSEKLNIAVWVSHPWLGDGLPQIYADTTSPTDVSISASDAISNQLETPPLTDYWFTDSDSRPSWEEPPPSVSPAPIITPDFPLPAPSSRGREYFDSPIPLLPKLSKTFANDDSRENLGLLLSCYLAELHGGEITLQGCIELGYRYVLSLPRLE